MSSLLTFVIRDLPVEFINVVNVYMAVSTDQVAVMHLLKKSFTKDYKNWMPDTSCVFRIEINK